MTIKKKLGFGTLLRHWMQRKSWFISIIEYKRKKIYVISRLWRCDLHNTIRKRLQLIRSRIWKGIRSGIKEKLTERVCGYKHPWLTVRLGVIKAGCNEPQILFKKKQRYFHNCSLYIIVIKKFLMLLNRIIWIVLLI